MTTAELIRQLARSERTGISDQVADPAALLDEIVRGWAQQVGSLVVSDIITREIDRIVSFENELDNAAPELSEDVHAQDDYARDAITEIEAQKRFDQWVNEQEEKRRKENELAGRPNYTGD